MTTKKEQQMSTRDNFVPSKGDEDYLTGGKHASGRSEEHTSELQSR